MRPLRACALLSAAVVLWSSAARAGDAAVAREQLKIGYALSQDGKCEEAIAHLQESVRLDPKALAYLNLANCEERTGRLAEALAHWVDARAHAQTEGVAPVEQEAERRQKALEPRIPRLTIVLAPGAPKDSTVTRDGVVLGAVSLGVPMPVNPGAHAIVVKAPGRAESTTEVTLAEAESKTVEVKPGEPRVADGEPPAKAGPERASEGHTSPLVWVGFGGAAAALAVGSVTGFMALERSNAAERDCPDLKCPSAEALDEVEAGRAFGTVSTVAFGAAAVLAGVGIYALVSGGKRGPAPASVAVRPGGFGLGGRF